MNQGNGPGMVVDVERLSQTRLVPIEFRVKKTSL